MGNVSMHIEGVRAFKKRRSRSRRRKGLRKHKARAR